MKCVFAKGNPIAVRVTDEQASKLINEGWSYCSKKIWKETGRHLLDNVWKKKCGGKS